MAIKVIQSAPEKSVVSSGSSASIGETISLNRYGQLEIIGTHVFNRDSKPITSDLASYPDSPVRLLPSSDRKVRDNGITNKGMGYNKNVDQIYILDTDSSVRKYSPSSLLFISTFNLSSSASNSRSIAVSPTNIFVGSSTGGIYKYSSTGSYISNSEGNDYSKVSYNDVSDTLYSMSSDYVDGIVDLQVWNPNTMVLSKTLNLDFSILGTNAVTGFIIDDSEEFLYIYYSANLYKFDLINNVLVGIHMVFTSAPANDGFIATEDLTTMWHWDSTDYLHEVLTVPCIGNLFSNKVTLNSSSDYTRIK